MCFYVSAQHDLMHSAQILVKPSAVVPSAICGGISSKSLQSVLFDIIDPLFSLNMCFCASSKRKERKQKIS